MARAFSVYSTKPITPAGLRKVMEHLKAEVDDDGWKLSRNGRSVFVEIDTQDLPSIPDDILRPAAELLKGWPVSSVALMFNDTAPDQFEARMARAVAIAMSELWPVVLDDSSTAPERLYPPGTRPDGE